MGLVHRIYGSPHINTGQATAGAAASELVPARAGRHSLAILNLSETEAVWIGPSGVTAGTGFRLKAGQSIALDTRAAVHGLRAGSADVAVCYIEEHW